MSQEDTGQNPDETPTPPASTRWSEDPVQGDDVLPAPFVPGRAPPAAGSPSPQPPAATPIDTLEAGETAETSKAAERSQPAETGESADEPFPFETAHEPEAEADEFPVEAFDIEGAGEADATGAATERTAGAETSADEAEWTPADLDWGEEDAGEAMDEAVAEPTEPAEPAEAADPWSASVGEPEPEPMAAPEPESAAEAVVEPEPEPVAAPESPEGAEIPEAARDVAALLERMAALLREEGVEAVRREMDASDRLTSLLAGLVAGYVSGRS